MSNEEITRRLTQEVTSTLKNLAKKRSLTPECVAEVAVALARVTKLPQDICTEITVLAHTKLLHDSLVSYRASLDTEFANARKS